MKRLCRWAVACVCVVVVGAAAGLAARLCTGTGPWRLKYQLASELEQSDPDYQKVICGPDSLSVALGRLGVGMASAEIASHCRVTPYGVALTDLERAAADLPTVSAAATKLDWDGLKAVDGAAVLFVKGNHYVATDPREAPPDGAAAAAVRIYDREVPARWYSREELEKIWSGEALVVTKRPTPPDVPDAARAAWDECYIDKGVLKDTATASFSFSLRNEGGEDLAIEGTTASCGCIKHELSAKRIAPGESARIVADVNLNGREGYIQQYVTVKTNDPHRPVSHLRMACGVPRMQPVSSQAIRLEDLPQGGNVRREFAVADTGFNGIKIRDARFLLRQGSRSADGVSCSVSYEMIGDDAKKVSDRIGFPASPGDYLIRLSFNADDACPAGPFEGDVVVTVEAGDSVVKHNVDIQGTIVQDVYSVPQMALIALGPDPESVGSAVIRLHSRANRKVAVTKAWSDGALPLEIRPQEGPKAGKNDYVVSVSMPELPTGTAPSNGTVMFELDENSVVSVPVTVFRPPQGVKKGT